MKRQKLDQRFSLTLCASARRWTLAAACWVFAAAAAYGSFEDASSGARMRSLAGAFAAVADDSETLFVQPAGLATLENAEASFTYGRLFIGLSDDSDLSDGIFSFAVPLSSRAGAGIGYKSVNLSGAYGEETLTAGGAWRPWRWISVGGALKYLRVTYGSDAYTEIDPLFSSGYAKSGLDADAGVLLAPFSGLTLAYSRQNVRGTDLGLKEESPASAAERTGLAYREETFLLTLESVKAGDRLRFLSGIEKTFINDLLRFRLGVGWGDRDFRKITSGIGINVSGFRLDYAWDCPLSGIEGTSGTHYVTFSARFGKQRGGSGRGPAEPQPAAGYTPGPAAGGIDADEELPPGFCAPVSSDTLKLFEYSAALSIPLFLPGSSSPEPVHLSAVLPEIEPSGDGSFSLEESTDTVAAPFELSATTGAPAVQPPVKTAEPAAAAAARRTENLQAAARPAGRTHKVRAGDTLPGLAEKYYGQRSMWLKIYEANKDRIEKGSLKPGEVLILP